MGRSCEGVGRWRIDCCGEGVGNTVLIESVESIARLSTRPIGGPRADGTSFVLIKDARKAKFSSKKFRQRQTVTLTVESNPNFVTVVR